MQHARRRSYKMHPLDLSPKANPLLFKRYSEDLKKIDNPLFHSKDTSIRRTMCTFGNKHEKDFGKRGRPRADILTTLMVEGSSSRSKIRCNKCGRVFPREKSLQAHLRTHTGERPYTCDFPGCTKAFCQSGQLKTHQRLHTGEKPFVCNVEGCKSRFTHANRHCSAHPNAGLKRTEVNPLQVAQQLNHDLKKSPEKEWLERYIRRCRDRLNSKESTMSKSDMIPLDMRKHSSTTSPRYSTKRKGSTVRATLSVSSTDSTIVPDSPKLNDDYRKNVFSSPLPQIPSFSQVSSSRQSPTPFPVTPPKAHQSSVTLTPITPRHPGSASSSDSSRSSLSSSASFTSASSAVRDLSHFMQNPPNPLPFYYHPMPVSIPMEKPSFGPSTYSSPIILDHTSHSPYYGQILPPPPSLTLTTLQTPRELNYSITTPVKGDKDRYISALALIELSKG